MNSSKAMGWEVKELTDSQIDSMIEEAQNSLEGCYSWTLQAELEQSLQNLLAEKERREYATNDALTIQEKIDEINAKISRIQAQADADDWLNWERWNQELSALETARYQLMRDAGMISADSFPNETI